MFDFVNIFCKMFILGFFFARRLAHSDTRNELWYLLEYSMSVGRIN